MKQVVNVKFITVNKNTREWARDYEKRFYSYLTDLNLKEGDIVVVDTAYGLALAEVKEVNAVDFHKATKWIVQKVDTETAKKRAEAEQKRRALVAQLKQRLKERDEMDLFADLAEKDESAKNLLEELKALDA
jgi:microcystin degradation protein MlrC